MSGVLEEVKEKIQPVRLTKPGDVKSVVDPKQMADEDSQRSWL